ncbi:MAG: hypothetical protein JO211_09480, partial [Acidobacteriaceae bacterium]|nr:hypothetical protein [Acidobacteriaceae bacterium]
MILPTTYIAALLLLVLSSVCLGSWIHTFKLAGTRWRFELFYIDFAVGAILFSVIAAFTFGSLGSDLAFTDRMLVAGRGAQVFVIAAGAVFNLGNMLLVAAVSLIGIAGAFPFSVGLALIIASFFQFRHGNAWLLIPGIALMLIAIVLDITTCRMGDRVASKAPAHREPASTASDAAASGQATREPVKRA